MATDLVDLLKDRRRELGLSYHSLAAACLDATSNTTVSAGWLHRLETGAPVIPPSLEMLGALAEGLQLPRVRLQEAAAAQYYGVRLSWEISGDAAAVLADLAVLPQGQRQAISDLIRVLAEGESDQPSR
jgi:transcriptional regulator with XRE-family HTH domain